MAAGRLAIAGLGMLATPLYTRILPPEEYGKLVLAIALSAIAAAAPAQWLTGAILRFAPGADPRSVRSRIVQSLPRNTVIGVLATVLPAIIVLGGEWPLIAAVGAYGAVDGFFLTLWVTARARLSVGMYVVAGIARQAFALLLAMLTGPPQTTATYVMLCMLAGSAIATVLLAAGLRWGPSDAAETAPLSEWFAFGWPLVINYLLLSSSLYVDRFLLNGQLGASAVGGYAATYDLLYAFVTLPASLVGLALVPKLYGTSDPSRRRDMLARLRRTVLVVSLGVAAVTLLVWPFVSRLLIGESVRMEGALVPVGLTVAFALNAIRFQLFNIILQADLQTRRQTLITGIGLACNVGANLVAIPRLGITGAMLATLMASLLAFVLAWASARTSSARLATSFARSSEAT
ncbi:lipopolysaccharide biosynthesis protein [Janibacter anophelis]|uniref:lipopolysaccharide biosynthesis protein n=1 Tax=Janibacter anophelis TaxID=319054 RepID=UPI0013B06B01|nr:oligosaccharide flippase family protein [Janibacter anophelis]